MMCRFAGTARLRRGERNPSADNRRRSDQRAALVIKPEICECCWRLDGRDLIEREVGQSAGFIAERALVC